MTIGLITFGYILAFLFFIAPSSQSISIPEIFRNFYSRFQHSQVNDTMPLPQLRRKILLLGSSTTQRSFSVEHHGWGAQLAHWYSRTADVLNRGAGGYNSRWTRRYLKRSFAGEKPDMTILFIGNNDSIQDNEPQHAPLTEYRDNLIAILDFLYQVNRNMIVLMVTTSCVNEETRPKHNNERRSQYAQIVRDVVAKRWDLPTPVPKHIALVDLQANDACHIGNDDLVDGMHFNRSGNRKVFEAIKTVINTQFPHFSPDFVPTSSVMKATKQAHRKTRGETSGDLSAIRDEITAVVPPPPGSLTRKTSLDTATAAGPGEEPLLSKEGVAGKSGGVQSQESAPLQMTVPYWSTLV